MPKYHVGVREVHVSTREIEADSPEEAIERAMEGDEIMCEYGHTLDPDVWTVEEVVMKKFTIETELDVQGFVVIEAATAPEAMRKFNAMTPAERKDVFEAQIETAPKVLPLVEPQEVEDQPSGG